MKLQTYLAGWEIFWQEKCLHVKRTDTSLLISLSFLSFYSFFSVSDRAPTLLFPSLWFPFFLPLPQLSFMVLLITSPPLHFFFFFTERSTKPSSCLSGFFLAFKWSYDSMVLSVGCCWASLNPESSRVLGPMLLQLWRKASVARRRKTTDRR